MYTILLLSFTLLTVIECKAFKRLVISKVLVLPVFLFIHYYRLFG